MMRITKLVNLFEWNDNDNQWQKMIVYRHSIRSPNHEIIITSKYFINLYIIYPIIQLMASHAVDE